MFTLPRLSPYSIDLSEQEEGELLRRAAKYTLPYFEVMRARMVLLAAKGLSNDQIAARLDTRREVVSNHLPGSCGTRSGGDEKGLAGRMIETAAPRTTGL